MRFRCSLIVSFSKYFLKMDRQEINDLREREKELKCLYRIMQLLKEERKDIEDVLINVVNEIPDGWLYPGICMVKLTYQNKQFTTPYFYETNWYHSSDILVDENIVGEIRVYYSQNKTGDPDKLFLPEEHQLLNNIAEQVSLFIFNRQLRDTLKFLKDDVFDEGKIELFPQRSDYHWKWRYKMAENLAERIDFEKFGIKNIYVIGSTEQATAGPGSDLDLLIHTDGNDQQRELLRTWVEGWSQSLAQMNFERTGYRLKDGLVDLHLVTTAELEDKKGSFASMVGSLENTAKLIKSANC